MSAEEDGSSKECQDGTDAPPDLERSEDSVGSVIASRLPLGVSEDVLNAFLSLPHSTALYSALDMDPHIHNLSGVFRELARLSEGDHIIYLRNTDSHNFFEIHRTGVHTLFTPTVAAFIPDVVIKLQLPLVSSIMTAVTRSSLVIVENLSDIINVVKHHKAAFIKEEATLAVWAGEVQSALAALHQVLKDLGVPLDRHDLMRRIPGDLSDINGEAIADSSTDRDAFDEFIHNYDDPTNKSRDESTFSQAGRNAPLPLGTLDDADAPKTMYTVSRTNLFDSLSSGSLALGDSAFLSSTVSSEMSRQCLNSTSLASPNPTFSSLPFDSSSPSISPGSPSDSSVLSTPLRVAIAPYVLSSPLSTRNRPQLPTISKSCMKETLQDTLPMHSVDLSAISPSVSDRELGADTPRKRKRSPKVKQVPSARGALPEKTRSRRASRAPTPKAAMSTSPRARKTVSKAIAPASPPSKSTEILESDDSGSEYEAEPFELELDELDDDDDDDYHPAKRTRGLSGSTWAALTTSESSVTVTSTTSVRRKAVSPKIASKKKKKSSVYGGKKKHKAKPEGPPPTCVWCDQEFTREADVLRHEQCSCKLYPFDRPLEYCPLCDKEISRNDAVIRHQVSGDCAKRQRELCEQGVLPSKMVKTMTKASARKVAKAVLSPGRDSASGALSA